MSRRSRGAGLTARDLMTTPDYPGREIEKPLGIVTSVHLTSALVHSEGHLKELMSPAISSCYKQLLRQADELDADAVVAVHFDCKQIHSDPKITSSWITVAVIMAYGTAVRLK